MMRTKLSRSLAIFAALALALALVGCDNGASPGASPGGGDQVVITVTNLPQWAGEELYLVLMTTQGEQQPNVIHAKGVATAQGDQAVFRMYAADANGNMTAQRFATAGSFLVHIGDDICCVTGTSYAVPITTGSQSMARDNATWWDC